MTKNKYIKLKDEPKTEIGKTKKNEPKQKLEKLKKQKGENLL